jgi:hypothetical protein
MDKELLKELNEAILKNLSKNSCISDYKVLESGRLVEEDEKSKD